MMKTVETIKPWLLLAGRLLLAGLFTYSAWVHLRDPVAFQIKVNEYNILPPAWERPFALILPWIMLGSSILLALGFFSRPAASALTLALASFLIAVGVNLYRQRVMGCGCFSEEGARIGWGLMAFDSFLLLLSLGLVVEGGGRFSLDQVIFGGRRKMKIFRSA